MTREKEGAPRSGHSGSWRLLFWLCLLLDVPLLPSSPEKNRAHNTDMYEIRGGEQNGDRDQK
jgi:hypothetical protein